MNLALHRRREARTGTDTLRLESKLLGSLCVPGEQVFHFTDGLPGFPEAGAFALVPTARKGVFWFQSCDFQALTFILVDPFRFVEGYSVDLGPQELGELHPEDASEILVLGILTLPRQKGEPATANLEGPVVLNLPLGLGRQLVLQGSPYDTRVPVSLPTL